MIYLDIVKPMYRSQLYPLFVFVEETASAL